MNTAIQPRTSPTVFGLPAMNRRKRNIEITLGSLQLTIIIALVTGSLFAVFALGFASGQSAGFEQSRSRSVADIAMLPVARTEGGRRARGTSQEIKGFGTAQGGAERQESEVVLGKIDSHQAVNAAAEPAEEQITAEIEPLDEPAGAAPMHSDSAPLDNGSAATEPMLRAESGTQTDAAIAALLEPSIRVLGQGQPAAGSASATANERAAGAGEEALLADLNRKRQDESKRSAATGEPTEPAKPVVKAVTESPKSKPTEIASSATIAKALAKQKDSENLTKPAATKQTSAAVSAKGITPRGLVKALPKGWYAQVAAMTDGKEIDRVTSKLRGAGFPALVESAEVRGARYYRILVGPEESRKQADLLLGQLTKEGYLKRDIFVRFVK